MIVKILENAERGGYTTEPPVLHSPFSAGSSTRPEFCRLPKPKARCPLTGLSRTSLVELIEAGKVRAVKLRKKGAVRGIVLINRQSLLDYLHSLETGGNQETR